MAQPVKNPPAMQETQVQSLGQEEPLEKEMAPHSSTLAWRILWSRGAWRATVHGVAQIRHDWATINLFFRRRQRGLMWIVGDFFAWVFCQLPFLYCGPPGSQEYAVLSATPTHLHLGEHKQLLPGPPSSQAPAPWPYSNKHAALP